MSTSSAVKQVCKLSHKQFRAMLKKFRRKKKRQQLAKEQEQLELLEQKKQENSPNYKEREEDRRRNSQLYEEFEERERLREHKQWLIREEQAQLLFKKKQQQQESEKIRREEERKRILEEFEKQQYIENKAVEESQMIKTQKEEALQAALSLLPEGDGPWHNPIAPEQYNSGIEREQCQFFAKTGCCRFGERCSRGHLYPPVSTTILIKGMYSHFSIDHTGREDFDTDMGLEYEDKETYHDFKTFYKDVLPEFKKFGKVIQFKVCSNHEAHLRGNVYVQYSKENEAIEAYKNFNGRYYAGKQITCEFTHVIKWRSAICGLYFRKICPKGKNCNFLHVFKNPSHEFWEADRDYPPMKEFIRPSYSHRSHHSRSNSERHSSQRGQSSEHRYQHRDSTPEYYRDHYHSSRGRSSDSDSDEEDRISTKSSRHKHRENGDSTRSHKRKYRDSRSRSQSPEAVLPDSESTSSHKKNKHKKKKKKKKSKKKNADEIDCD